MCVLKSKKREEEIRILGIQIKALLTPLDTVPPEKGPRQGIGAGMRL